MVNLASDCGLLNVLIVEDEELIREITAEMLSHSFKNVYTAENGKIGLELYEKLHPDLIISDIKMPVMDGIEMLKRIREKDKEIPVVISTAFDDISLVAELVRLGVNRYILKPFNKVQFGDIIKGICVEIKSKKEIAFYRERLALQQITDAKMEILNEIAHQWRQPIATISMKANNLILDSQMGTLHNDELVPALEDINQSLIKLSKTIDSFTEIFSQTIEEEEVRLEEIVGDAISMAEDMFRGKMKFELDASYDGVQKIAAKELHSILLGIFINASEACAKIGKEDACVKITLKEEDGNIYIVSEDCCGGIDEEKIRYVFEPYFTTKDDLNGKGLGLFKAKHFVERYLAGNITLENTQKGAKVTIKFPVEKNIRR